MTTPKLESQLEKFFRRRVQMLGGHTVKLAPTERGVPDRLVILRGQLYLVELKTADGRLSPGQRHWHDRMSELGVVVHTLYGEDQVVRWLRRRINALGPHKRHDARDVARLD